jgi:dTDP-4-amino-4,6-dideoxygalactose transaminase
VFIDVDPAYYSIDDNQIEAAITSNTKAIVLVHLQGQACDLDKIEAICKSHNIYLIEDCAQSHFSEFNGRRAGTVGIAGSFSFYPGKNLGAIGDGGIVTTNDQWIAERVRILANYGSKTKYQNIVKGFNSRLDEIQAAFLRVKLKFLDDSNRLRSIIANKYLSSLSELDIVLPQVPSWSNSVWHLFVIRFSKRNLLKDRLSDRGVHTLIHYPIPPHLQEAYSSLGYRRGSFPISEKIHDEVLSLPIGSHLNQEMIEYTVSSLRDSVKQIS